VSNVKHQRGQQSYSIIRNLTFGLATIVGLVLLLAVLVIASVSYIAARESDIRDNYDPRARLNEMIQASIIDQEVAVRGYVFSGNPEFLETFDQSRAQYLAARDELEEYPPLNASFAELRQAEFDAADAWYDTIALPAIADVQTGGASGDTTPALLESRESIDTFRATHAAYQSALDIQILSNVERVEDIRRLVTILALVASLAILLMTMLLSWVILKSIREPLETLGSEVAAVDAGATSRRVPALNAVEFDQLGRGINRMLDNLDTSIQESEFQQRRLSTIVESANDGIVVIDADGQITTINPTAARMFSVGIDAATGSQAADLGLFTQQDFALGLDRVGKARGEGQPLVRRYGDVVLSAVVSPLSTSVAFPGGRADANGWVCVIRDVTELTRIDEMKNEFIAVVSHELRTPLTAIKGFTDLILEGEAGEVTDSQREFLEIVQSNSDRLVALINDMLDISRIESGRIALSLDEVLIEDVIIQALAALRPLVDEKQLNMRTEIAEELPPIVGDAGRLLQILTNLVSNACNYTPAGGWITISAEPMDGLVAVSVSDTGIDIPADALPRVFSKFYRVDQAAAREIGGTGLSLAITKSLVEMHGGRITIARRASPPAIS